MTTKERTEQLSRAILGAGDAPHTMRTSATLYVRDAH